MTTSERIPAAAPLGAGLAWLALAAATGWLVRAEARRPERPEGVRAVTDLVYREAVGRRPRLDVYVPAGRPAPGGGWPVVVAVHGGGWRGGSKGDYGRSLAPLVRRGVAVVAVDYRLSRPGSPGWPENLDDVREAVRWVGRHAADFGIDPDRLALMGASAGGHLALLAGLGPEAVGGPRVRAVVDFYGPTDLRALAGPGSNAAGSVGLLLGDPPARYDAASPLRHVRPGGPPVLIVHGTDDRLVPPDQSRSLADALGRAGVAHRLALIDGARHGFGLEVNLPGGTRDLVPEILSFLGSAWGEGPKNSGAGVGSVDQRGLHFSARPEIIKGRTSSPN